MSEDFNALSRLMEARHSCRAFLPNPVPNHVIEQIILAACQAPSWCNAQPWKVTCTRGAQTDSFRDALLTAVGSTKPEPDLAWPQDYPGVYGDRRRACGYQLYDAVGIIRSDHAARTQQSLQNFNFFGAPHVAIISTDAVLGPYGALDCGGFITAFMLAATALGVGTIAQASVAGYAPVIRDHFGLPEDRQILCAISLGYADADHPANSFRTDRAGLLEIYDMRE